MEANKISNNDDKIVIKYEKNFRFFLKKGIWIRYLKEGDGKVVQEKGYWSRLNQNNYIIMIIICIFIKSIDGGESC